MPKEIPKIKPAQIILKQQISYQPRHKSYDFAPINQFLQLPGPQPKCQTYCLYDEMNQIIHESSMIGSDFDMQCAQQTEPLIIELPVMKMQIVYRDSEQFQTIPLQTPSNIKIKQQHLQATNPPFSALQQRRKAIELFSPQYHLQAIYRSMSFDTPGTKGLPYQYNVDNMIFEDMADDYPLQMYEKMYDKPPKLPKKVEK